MAPVMAALPPQVDVARIAALKVVQPLRADIAEQLGDPCAGSFAGNEDCALA